MVLQRTQSEIAANIKKGAENRALGKSRPKPKFMTFASSVKPRPVSTLSTNFNKYAKEILQNLNRNKKSLPNPNNPNFTQTIMEKVRQKYNRNNPSQTSVKLNKNSFYIQAALTQIRNRFDEMKNTSTRHQTTRSPLKSVARAVNGGGLRPNPAKATHKIFKEYRKPSKKLGKSENRIVKNMINRVIKKVVRGDKAKKITMEVVRGDKPKKITMEVVRGATPPKNIAMLTGSTRCDILQHCDKKASAKNPITLDMFKMALLPETFAKMSTGDKRLFFCKKMGRDKEYCDRVYSLLKKNNN